MAGKGSTPSKAQTPVVQRVAYPTSSRSAAEIRPLPLLHRPHDILIAFWFVVFCFTTTFTDIHNFAASFYGVKVEALESMGLPYPPRVLTAVYFRWARTVDPLLYENPTFWQAIEWVNMLVLTPFAVVAIAAVLRGSPWVRMPAVVVSSFTFYSLILCMGVTLFGDKPSADPAMFVGVYQLYLLFPLLVIARFWSDNAFSTRLGSQMASAAWWLLGSTTFAVFFSYVLKWMVVYGSDYLPDGAAEKLVGVRSLP